VHHHFTPEEWQRIQGQPEFQELVAAKRRFIIPATIFFVLYYFALPVLVGYHPALMSRRVFGEVNLAYLFALSEFVMAWLIMALYLRRAKRFDQLEQVLIARVRSDYQ